MTVTPDTKTKKLLSATEVQEMISELAQDGDGSDRRWALKMLSAQGTTGIVLPEPLSGEEIQKRLTMLMRAAGREMAKRCYAKAFRFRPINEVETEVPDLDAADIKEFVDLKKIPHSLKQMNRRYPELKTRGGFPKGYPRGKGPLLQREWIRRYVLSYIRDKHEKNLLADKEAAKTKGGDANATGPAEDSSTVHRHDVVKGAAHPIEHADDVVMDQHKDVNATETDTGQGIQPDSPGENQEPR